MTEGTSAQKRRIMNDFEGGDKIQSTLCSLRCLGSALVVKGFARIEGCLGLWERLGKKEMVRVSYFVGLGSGVCLQ